MSCDENRGFTNKKVIFKQLLEMLLTDDEASTLGIF